MSILTKLLGYLVSNETDNFLGYFRFFKFYGHPATKRFWNFRNASHNEILTQAFLSLARDQTVVKYFKGQDKIS